MSSDGPPSAERKSRPPRAASLTGATDPRGSASTGRERGPVAQSATAEGADVDASDEAPPPAASWVVWVKRLAFAGLVLAVAGAVAVAVFVRHYEKDLPSVSELRAYNPPQMTRVLARDGTLLGELFVERRTVVSINQIPPQMKLAALAAEDASFYEHAGLNYLGMLRAIAVNLRSSHARQGGSTITQQVIKNVLLTPEKTLARKVREALLARRIEQELSKDEILELYLNQINFGHGRYGVEEAARFYFGKSVKDVTLAEAAMMAGVVKGPGVYSPRIDMSRAIERRNVVLEQMAVKGFAPRDQTDLAKKEPIVLVDEKAVESGLAPEVVDEVRRTLHELVGDGAERGGFTITTTIDPELEAAARAAVRRNADDYAKRHKSLAPLAKVKKEPAAFTGTPSGHKSYLGVVTGADDTKNTLEVKVGTLTGTVDLSEAARYNPKALPASQFADVGHVVRVVLASDPKDAISMGPQAAPNPGPGRGPKPRFRLELGPEGALVAVDVRSREILALVGSYEGVRGGLDRASHARRQPGSTFKTFVYSYALHARQMTAATIVETRPSALKGYNPQNFDEGEGKTPKRVREALAQSVNVAAVWSLEKVGASNVVAWTHALGVESKLGADLSLALGSYEVTPREMAAAYTTFASGGIAEEPILIKRITGPGGAVVELPPRAPSRRVMDEAEAYLTTNLLASVISEGTGKRAKNLARPVVGKTGTSNQAKDGWFVGYSPDVVCAVWTGFDDPTPMGAGEAGATLALPAWIDFMREATKKKTPADFAVPPGLVHVSIDPDTGLRAYPDEKNALDEVFLAGTEPTKVSEPDAGTGDAADAGAPASPSIAPAASVAVDDKPTGPRPADRPAASPNQPPLPPPF